jgi:hypothetical protein
MIRTFRCKDTEKLFNDKRVSRFHSIEWQARKKLLYLHAATSLDVVGVFQVVGLKRLRARGRGSIVFVLISSGVSVLNGKMGTPLMLKLLTITKDNL